MLTKVAKSIFLGAIYFTSLYSFSLFSTFTEQNEEYVHKLASLLFHTREREKSLCSEEASSKEFIFSEEESSSLWSTLYPHFHQSKNLDEVEEELYFVLAHQHYEYSKIYRYQGLLDEARDSMCSACELLYSLWAKAIAFDEVDVVDEPRNIASTIRSKVDPNVYDNPHITKDIKKKMQPYLLSMKHPMRSAMDDIFLAQRVTSDGKAFYRGGFKTLARGPRSYIRVAKHSKLPGYLVKAHMDTDMKEKRSQPSWKWLVNRCEGAKKIERIIQKRDIQHFVVAKKWLYCLPSDPSPPNDPFHVRHLALLLVTDMNLAPSKQNYQAWYSKISEEQLNELYYIISRAKGSSYRPDNIALTNDGKFAFIDTEYPDNGPDFKSIREYLNPERIRYWDRLVKTGGSPPNSKIHRSISMPPLLEITPCATFSRKHA